jgi:hypothetical protein
VKSAFASSEMKSCSNVFLSGNSVFFILCIIQIMFFFEIKKSLMNMKPFFQECFWLDYTSFLI